MSNRIAIYTFYEHKGIVRNYVTNYLSVLFEVATRILVVVNGLLTAESRTKLEDLGCEILQRGNYGLDFGAWKAGLNFITWDELEKYDELILCNYSCYGPIGISFKNMFDEMNSRHYSNSYAFNDVLNCNFWGITLQPIQNIEIKNVSDSLCVWKNLHTKFVTFRKSAFTHKAFQKWWNDLVEYDDLEREILEHEFKFVKYLNKNGLSSDSYINFDKYHFLKSCECVDFLYALEMVKTSNLCLINKEIFAEYQYFFTKSLANSSRNLLDYLTTNYPIHANNIWENLLATYPISKIKLSLHLNFTFSSNNIFNTNMQSPNIKAKIAIICYGYYQELAAENLRYISNAPKNSSVFIVSSKENTLNFYKSQIALLQKNNKCLFNSIDYRLKNNQGRDLSALLVTCKDVFSNYDYICFIHDKKSPHLGIDLTSRDFSYHCMDNCLHNEIYIYNIINAFNSNPRLGMLVPPTIYFADFIALGNELGEENKYWYNQLYSIFKINCPIDSEPVAPFGSMFWVRSDAMRTILNKNWDYVDFPTEPMALDGTISHALERFFPSCVQNDGFYTAWGMSDDFESCYLNNVTNSLKKYNNILYKLICKAGSQHLISILNQTYENRQNIHNINNNIYGKTLYIKKIIKYKILVICTFGLIKKFKDRLSNLNQEAKIRNIKL